MNILGFRFREMNETMWITANGRHIQVVDMELSHLIRTINLLRRKELGLRLIYLHRMDKYIANAPDGAAMACEMEANMICKMTRDQFLEMLVPPFRTMIRSLNARMP